jgi:MFS family permease
MSHRSDIALLFTTRIIRLFAYGFLSVVLVLYLVQLGLNEAQVGLLLTLALFGDAAISLLITTRADRIGRRKMLVLGGALVVFAGLVFLLTSNPVLLIVAAVVGVISPSGNEIGPFLSIEQASLTQLVPDRKRTQTFAWYNMAGSLATATGALISGVLAQALQGAGLAAAEAYRAVLIGYTLCGLILIVLFTRVSSCIEAPPSPQVEAQAFGLSSASRGIVARLSALFALDAFAGGFIVQSIVAYWFYVKFNVEPATLGAIFFGANILAGISALSAAWIAKKIGLINTMVFTHLPSNILLMLVPLMPTLPSATVLLLLRFSISQMDVPTRQSYTMAVVKPDERSAASGVTTIARSIGAAVSPSLTGVILANPALLGLPFFLSGGLKVLYDLLLYRSFRAVKPPEEQRQ